MESAKVNSVSQENIRSNGFMYSDISLDVIAESGHVRKLVVRAIKGASGFAQRLKKGEVVSLIYPGENPVSGVCIFVTVETRIDSGKTWNDFKAHKITLV